MSIGSFSSVNAQAKNPHVQHNYGRVGLLYPTDSGYYFTLVGGKTSMQPKDGYYFVVSTHKNYKSLTELLFRAAEMGWTINVRTEDALDAKGHARVNYFTVKTNNK